MGAEEFGLLMLVIKGASIGFVIGIPVGPTALLLIRRTIVSGWAGGLSVSAGAAFADAVYGGVAAYGLSLVGNFFIHYKEWVSVIGFIILVSLGIVEWRSHPPDPLANNPTDPKTLIRGFVVSFSITFFNPMTLFSMTAIMAGFGVLGQGVGKLGDPVYGDFAIVLFITALFLGSLIWWTLLTLITKFIKNRLSQKMLLRLSRFSAILLIGFGIYVLTYAFQITEEQSNNHLDDLAPNFMSYLPNEVDFSPLGSSSYREVTLAKMLLSEDTVK